MSCIYLRASEIDQAVRGLYKKNGFVVLSQVRNGVGFGKEPRTADMLAISTWPSRGLFVEGFEIKTSRTDLQRELADPAKADEIAKYCTFWWLAVSEGLITDSMAIPETWGIISVNDKLTAKVIRRRQMPDPVPMDVLLACSVLRNFSESYVHISTIEPKIKAAREEAQKEAEGRASSKLKELQEAYFAFKQSSGVDLLGDYGHPSWNMKGIGEAVKLITELRHAPVAEILAAKQSLTDSIAAIDSAIQILDKSERIPA